jgi:S1-C subfamily serine protease
MSQRARALRGFAIAAVLLLAASCAPRDAFKVGDEQYTNPADALDALRRKEEGYNAALAKEGDPIKGSILIVLPDRDRVRPLATEQFAKRQKRQPSAAETQFNIEVYEIGLHAGADAIVRSGAFQSATVVEQNDTYKPEPLGADYVLWYRVATVQPNTSGPWLGLWRVRRAGSDAEQGAGADLGTAQGTPRVASFVTSVRDAALRLGGATVAGRNTPSHQAAAGIIGPGFGSGIVIGAQGHVLTNDHVVKNCGGVTVTDSANEPYPATVFAHDAANDLAVVKVEHHWENEAALRENREVRPGEPITITGFPLSGIVGRDMIVTTGTVSALTGLDDDSRYLQMSAPIQPGNSGGPVLDASADVVGVTSMTISGLPMALATGGAVPQNANFAIKTAVVRNFLDAKGIAYRKAAPHREMSAADVADVARKFTVRVECKR